MDEEEVQTQPPTNSQNSAVAFLIFLIVIGLLALAFFFGMKYRQTPGGIAPTPTPEITNVPSPQPTPTPEEVSPTPTSEVTVTPTPTIKPTSNPTPTSSLKINPNLLRKITTVTPTP